MSIGRYAIFISNKIGVHWLANANPKVNMELKSNHINTCVSAGAGTGKTYALVQHYIRLLNENKAGVSEITAITFTEKAAKEMKDRIRKECGSEHKKDLEGARIGTIHSFCARILRENIVPAGIDPKFRVLDGAESYTLIDRIAHKEMLMLLDKGDSSVPCLISEYGLRNAKDMLVTLINERLDASKSIERFFAMAEKDILDFWKRRAYKEDAFDEELEAKCIAVSGHIFRLSGKIEKAYSEYKQREGFLDFNDLIIKTIKLFRENKNIRRRYQNSIKYLLVDEFQDTDMHQRELLFYLAEDPLFPPADSFDGIALSRDKLFIVGDQKQSIYRFRGADAAVFEETRKIIMRTGTGADLTDNYRSRPAILSFVNDFFGGLMGRDRNGKADYESHYTDIFPKRNDISDGPCVEFLQTRSGDKLSAKGFRMLEADNIARRILQIVQDGKTVSDKQSQAVRYKDIAVLFRAMTDSDIYENALKKYNIPYFIVSGSGFYAKQEIIDIVNFLKALDNGRDYISIIGVMRSAMFCVDDDTIFRIRQVGGNFMDSVKNSHKQGLVNFYNIYTELRAVKNRISISALIEEVVLKTDYYSRLAVLHHGEQKILNVKKLIASAGIFEEKGIFTLSDFIKYIDRYVSYEMREGEASILDEESDAVKIMTIHKAKGLEFPVVIIPDTSRLMIFRCGRVIYDREYPGIGIKVKDQDGIYQESLPRKLIRDELKNKDAAENKRLLYVASTRAMDYLIYSGGFDKDSKDNTWAGWIGSRYNIDFTKNNTAVVNGGIKIKVTADIPEVKMPKQEKTLLEQYTGLIKNIEPLPLPSPDNKTADIMRRAEPILKYRSLKSVFTATELSDYMKCPKRYELRYIYGVPELHIDAKDSGISPLMLGTLSHRFFEKWDLKEEHIPQVISSITEEDQYRKEIRSFAEKFINSTIYKELLSAELIKSELALTFEYNGHIFEGVIDKMYKTGGKYKILDFKTDNISVKEAGGRAKEYGLQLFIYSIGLKRVLNVLPDQLIIYFLKPGSYNAIENMDFSPDKIISDIENQIFPTTDNDKYCGYCGYKSLCGKTLATNCSPDTFNRNVLCHPGA